MVIAISLVCCSISENLFCAVKARMGVNRPLYTSLWSQLSLCLVDALAARTPFAWHLCLRDTTGRVTKDTPNHDSCVNFEPTALPEVGPNDLEAGPVDSASFGMWSAMRCGKMRQAR